MIIIGIGSNLSSSFGNRFKNIDLALEHLKTYNVKVIKKSSFYETLSFPNKKDPKFINIVAEISTNLPSEELASILLSIEEKLERKRNLKNEPRTCDIDIIDFNSMVINFKYKSLNFIVPHINLVYRNFVLIPLQEIKPNWKHPKTKESINILIDKLSKEDKKSILKIRKS